MGRPYSSIICYITDQEVQVKETTDGQFFYVDFGGGSRWDHGLRVWVSEKLVTKSEVEQWYWNRKVGVITKLHIRFPANAYLHRTERGTLILRPSENKIVHAFWVVGGYRGNSDFEVLEPTSAVVEKFTIWHSFRGSLGTSAGALVEVEKGQRVVIRFERTGRLYGTAASGIAEIREDGSITILENVADGIEELQEIRRLTD